MRPAQEATRRGRPVMPTEAKPCGWCSVTMERRRLSSGRWETPQAFAARQFCSSQCANRDLAQRTREARPRVFHGYHLCVVCSHYRRPDQVVPHPLDGWSRCEDAAACQALKNAEPGPLAGRGP